MPELVAATEDYVAHHNERRRSFVCTAKAADILEKMLPVQGVLERRPYNYLLPTA